MYWCCSRFATIATIFYTEVSFVEHFDLVIHHIFEIYSIQLCTKFSFPYTITKSTLSKGLNNLLCIKKGISKQIM